MVRFSFKATLLGVHVCIDLLYIDLFSCVCVCFFFVCVCCSRATLSRISVSLNLMMSSTL